LRVIVEKGKAIPLNQITYNDTNNLFPLIGGEHDTLPTIMRYVTDPRDPHKRM